MKSVEEKVNSSPVKSDNPLPVLYNSSVVKSNLHATHDSSVVKREVNEIKRYINSKRKGNPLLKRMLKTSKIK